MKSKKTLKKRGVFKKILSLVMALAMISLNFQVAFAVDSISAALGSVSPSNTVIVTGNFDAGTETTMEILDSWTLGTFPPPTPPPVFPTSVIYSAGAGTTWTATLTFANDVAAGETINLLIPPPPPIPPALPGNPTIYSTTISSPDYGFTFTLNTSESSVSDWVVDANLGNIPNMPGSCTFLSQASTYSLKDDGSTFGTPNSISDVSCLEGDSNPDTFKLHFSPPPTCDASIFSILTDADNPQTDTISGDCSQLGGGMPPDWGTDPGDSYDMSVTVNWAEWTGYDIAVAAYYSGVNPDTSDPNGMIFIPYNSSTSNSGTIYIPTVPGETVTLIAYWWSDGNTNSNPTAMSSSVGPISISSVGSNVASFTLSGYCGDAVCSYGEVCAADCAGEDYCGDGVDNNDDTNTDCYDSTCSADPLCEAGYCGDAICEYGEACSTDCAAGEGYCTDGVDNDQNGQADCSDSSCSADPSCMGGGTGYCGDGYADYTTNENCDDGSYNGQSGYCNSYCSGQTDDGGNSEGPMPLLAFAYEDDLNTMYVKFAGSVEEYSEGICTDIQAGDSFPISNNFPINGYVKGVNSTCHTVRVSETYEPNILVFVYDFDLETDPPGIGDEIDLGDGYGVDITFFENMDDGGVKFTDELNGVLVDTFTNYDPTAYFFYRTLSDEETPTNEFGYGYGYGKGVANDWGLSYGFGYGYDYFAQSMDGWMYDSGFYGWGLSVGSSYGEFALPTNDGEMEIPFPLNLPGTGSLSGSSVNLPEDLLLKGDNWDGIINVTAGTTVPSAISGDFSSAVVVTISTGGIALGASKALVVSIPYPGFDELNNPLVMMVDGAGNPYPIYECGGQYIGGSLGSPASYSMLDNTNLDHSDQCYIYSDDVVYVATNHFTAFAAGEESGGDEPTRGGSTGIGYYLPMKEKNFALELTEITFEELTGLKDPSWQSEALNSILDLGLFQGNTVNGKVAFDIKGTMTRGMAAVVICRYMGCDENAEITNVPFQDVKKGSYYAASVGYLKDKGIVRGRGSNTFDPNVAITKAQFLKMIIKAYMAMNPSVETEWKEIMTSSPIMFADVTKDNWYYNYMVLAGEKGIIKGTVEKDRKYAKAGKTITRAEAAAMLANLFGE